MPVWVPGLRDEPLLSSPHAYPGDDAQGDRFLPEGDPAPSRIREGGEEGEGRKPFSKAIVRLEIEIFLEGYYKAWSMGSGPCDLCKECNLSGSCKHGLEARPSMEACGIDVFKTARDNGFPIEVVRTRDEERNMFGVILVE
jgi:predicted metal-binding protein